MADAAPKNPTIPPRTTGAVLKAWRERMGYSQREACERLDCSRGAWAKWEADETGESIPGYIGLACAALALGMTAYGEVK